MSTPSPNPLPTPEQKTLETYAKTDESISADANDSSSDTGPLPQVGLEPNPEAKDKPDPQTDPVLPPAPVHLPKIGFDYATGKYSGIANTAYLDLWKEAYPAIDVMAELKKSAAWLVSNPKNRKSSFSRFINLWLKKHKTRPPH